VGVAKGQRFASFDWLFARQGMGKAHAACPGLDPGSDAIGGRDPAAALAALAPVGVRLRCAPAAQRERPEISIFRLAFVTFR